MPKFSGPGWSTYMQWPNVIDAISNCTTSPDSDAVSRWGGRDKKCWSQLDCALTAADASQQAQYSSSGTILGLLPTVLSMMAISNVDLINIHHRHPLLALLLSLCNPSTIFDGLKSSLNSSERIKLADSRLNTQRARISWSSKPRGFSFTFGMKASRLDLCHDVFLHVLAAGVASMMIYQASILGVRGVIVFACWTWHEPFTWVAVGGLSHFLAVISYRLCLGHSKDSSHPLHQNRSESSSITDRSTAVTRWTLYLSRDGKNIALVHARWARFLDLFFQVLGLMNYGYGTVILSGMSLVSPLFALQVFCFMGFPALVSKLVAIWLLEVVPRDKPRERVEEQMAAWPLKTNEHTNEGINFKGAVTL